MTKPSAVELIWEHDLVFAGKAGEAGLTLDSQSQAGPSPMQAVIFGLAGCMAMDLVHILKKGRHDLRGLRAVLTAARADDDPKRFTDITLHYTITGTVEAEYIERAIELSRETYCSVWHSMRQDINLKVTYSVSTGT